MEHINNEPDRVEIRRLQDNLTIVGSGIIAFGIWTAVKVTGSVFMLKSETIMALRKMSGLQNDIPDDVIFYVLIAISGIFFLIDILLRSYIGLSAIREGRGNRKHKGRGYLVIAGLMVVLSIVSIVSPFASPDRQVVTVGAFSNKTSISSIIIELTSAAMLFEMIIAAVRIRKLRSA